MLRYSILLLTMTEYSECWDSIRWKQGNRFRAEQWMAGLESETSRRDWRRGMGGLEDVVSVGVGEGEGEGDERLGKEQKGTAAKGSFIPIRKRRGRGRGRAGGEEGEEEEEKEEKGRREGDWDGVNEWQAEWRRKGSNRPVGELYTTGC